MASRRRTTCTQSAMTTVVKHHVTKDCSGVVPDCLRMAAGHRQSRVTLLSWWRTNESMCRCTIVSAKMNDGCPEGLVSLHLHPYCICRVVCMVMHGVTRPWAQPNIFPRELLAYPGLGAFSWVGFRHGCVAVLSVSSFRSAVVNRLLDSL